MCPRNSKTALNANKNANSFPTKSAAETFCKNQDLLPPAVHECDKSTNRIKSQLVGMKALISANQACFKQTILNYQ
jgi:hypothetical protein